MRKSLPLASHLELVGPTKMKILPNPGWKITTVVCMDGDATVHFFSLGAKRRPQCTSRVSGVIKVAGQKWFLSGLYTKARSYGGIFVKKKPAVIRVQL